MECESLRDLLTYLDPRYNVPTRKHLTNVLIKQRFEELLDQVMKLLESAMQVSVTLDLWQMRSFIGITAHFVCNWKLQSAMLSCSRFKGRHTGESIFQEYENTMETFNISSKVKHVITDHASNMLKAFNLPGYEEEEEEDTDDDMKILIPQVLMTTVPV